MVTPHLTLKDIPMVVVNHTYKEIGLYPKDIVGGGTGSYYSADNIYILGRQQEKDGQDLVGYNFIINVEKSRYVREKARIPVTVRFDGGISRYSGLLDMALESGAVFAPYIPLIMTPLVYDPNTFTPRKGLMTRYAKKMLRPEFYGKIYVSGLNSL